MENDFRNLTTKVRIYLDNPIKSFDFFKVLINFLYAALSGNTLLYTNCVVTAVQLSNDRTAQKCYKILLFMKI